MKTNYSKKAADVVMNIRALRENRNYTQDYMAMRMQISQNSYSKIELGNCKLTVSKLLEICHILEVAVEELIASDIKKVSFRLADGPVIYQELYTSFKRQTNVRTLYPGDRQPDIPLTEIPV
ncbi:XRE family transcriptional regulator [Mucilaginibacter conchicola]|uniref:XRE family transcriptional regulator n=1 Tax=Mucilaginibacter conchicola TaxID=2303333 RepID=A0A372NRR3_9SPHI|nr:helix-turn-helix transcriptional regulator [Mucilaginibacter conchicola]RFZ91287.1 XRE family transcriptional regulator [Mucilaginibacter conchicola]